ncbi:Hypothetical predicted protein [Marmota monax]|uniref:Uncharacterized protein n=1 Tax=Marmota monax TaxID=9995 RepID=A0A5E4BML4_MARMO|nr:Hypothetical predicted protein [Marmota monax]
MSAAPGSPVALVSMQLSPPPVTGIVSAESREAGKLELGCSRSGLGVCVLRGPDCTPQIHVSSALPSDPGQTAFIQFTAPYARAVEESRFLEIKPCRRRLFPGATLRGAALVHDRSCAKEPVPNPQGPSGWRCGSLAPSSEAWVPSRGMQNDPRASSARGCSGEQATQALKAVIQPLEDRARHAAQLQPLGAAAGQCSHSHQDSRQKANGGSRGVDFRHRNRSPAKDPNPQTLPV